MTVGTIVEHDIAMPLTLGMPAPTIDVEPIVVVNVEWQRGPRMWYAMAWLGENLIGMAPGHSRRAALYAVGKDIDEWFGVVRLLPALDAPQSINLSWMGPRPARPR